MSVDRWDALDSAPEGFAVDRAETWPRVTGRLEYVAEGRLEVDAAGHVPPHPSLPELTPPVAVFFRQF